MSILQSLILGIVQGVTEFLPISSSGHLIIVSRLFGWPDQGLVFDTMIHLGSLAAIVLYFRQRYMDLFRSSKTRQVFLGIAISSLPALLLGFVLETLDPGWMRNTLLVACMLILVGGLLILADLFSRSRNNLIRTLEEIPLGKMLLVGLAQAIALIPGTSRSGVTISTGLLAGIDRRTSISFSFLLGSMAIFVAGAYQCFSLVTEMNAESGISLEIAPAAIGLVTAFVSSLLTISILLKVIERVSFIPFGIYRVILGLAILLLFRL